MTENNYKLIIENQTNDVERAYYASKDTLFQNIFISGPADGESAFKESKNIKILNSHFELRYPCWHNKNLILENVKMENTCRAALWYVETVFMNNCLSNGVKIFRECNEINVLNSTIISEEPFWKCTNIFIKDSQIEGFYGFFESKNVTLSNIKFNGKYSFQYIRNLNIDHCELNTKDAFWHTKDAIITNSTIIGEYLGWYSENITFINCHISGTQPLCYCKNLRLINCTFDKNADLAFEYSEVNGNIIGDVTSIKNPLSGNLEISGKSNLIQDKNDKSHHKFNLK